MEQYRESKRSMKLSNLIQRYVDSVRLLSLNDPYPDDETWFYNSIIWIRDKIQEEIKHTPYSKNKEIIMDCDNKLISNTYKIDYPFLKNFNRSYWWHFVIPKMPVNFSPVIIEINLYSLKTQGFNLDKFKSESMYPNFFSSDDPAIKYQSRFHPLPNRAERVPRRRPEVDE